jgi:hypothetical protein
LTIIPEDQTVRLPRFTVRRLMFVVAIAALLVWSCTVVMQWESYRRRAEDHEQTIRVLSSEIQALRGQAGKADQVRMREEVMAEEMMLLRRCRRGVRRPWLPLSSLLSEPKDSP